MLPPLSEIKVLDFTRAMAGPFCTQLLGDLGAEIIKVESTDGGDETRQWGPFWNETSCYFLSANRNKKSIALNLKKEAGIQIARKFAEKCDVVIENFRPGTVNRLGIDYECLSKINPRLVYCSISGFGQNGPRSQEPAYDLLMQAFSGLMSLTGSDDVEGEPVRAGLPVTDLTAGLFSTIGILTALYSRERTGVGQKVETSLLEGQISWLSYYVIGYYANKIIPKPMGSAHHSLAPYGAYRAKDEFFVVAVGNDTQWKRLCGAINKSDLLLDERFQTNLGRLKNRSEMDEILNYEFQQYTAEDLICRISDAGVPCGPINAINKVVQDPQTVYLEMVKPLPHPKIPDLVVPGIPIKFSQTPGDIQSPPPSFGEHTDALLAELGMSSETIYSLRQEGVIC